MPANLSTIEHIRSEYRRIDEKWLRTQYALMLGLACFAFAAEFVMSLLLSKLDLIPISLSTYLVKYLLFPTAADALLLGAATWVLRSPLSVKGKTYTISLLITAMAVVLYSVHSIFPSLTLIFLIPMTLTVLYGDLRLTSLVGGLSIAGKAVSDLFLFWDPGRKSVFASSRSLIDFGISLLLLGLFYGVCCILLSTERSKAQVSIRLEEERERLWKRSSTDSLTRVGNRHALRDAFDRLIPRAESDPLFLAMLDMDDFKALNDTFGHGTGDQYLRILGDVLLSVSSDRIQTFRFGGDEFCVLFSGCTQEETLETCRRIQTDFGEKDIQTSCRPVSLSIGVARYLPGDTPSILFNRADQALYRAKETKNTVFYLQ